MYIQIEQTIFGVREGLKINNAKRVTEQEYRGKKGRRKQGRARKKEGKKEGEEGGGGGEEEGRTGCNVLGFQFPCITRTYNSKKWT